MPCDPAHIPHERYGTMADKANDNQAVPLCRKDHDKQHRIGHPAFWGNRRQKAIDLASGLHVITGNDEMALKMIYRFQHESV